VAIVLGGARTDFRIDKNFRVFKNIRVYRRIRIERRFWVELKVVFRKKASAVRWCIRFDLRRTDFKKE
jgi:hypothetical protein